MVSFIPVRPLRAVWLAVFGLALLVPAHGVPKTAPAPVPAAPPVIAPNAPHYFYTIDLDPRYQIVGRGALTEEAAATANCYCFTYDDKGKLQRIEYRRAGVPTLDPFFQTVRVDFEYQPNLERRWYRDAQGRPLKNVDDIYGEELQLNPAGFPTNVANLNESGGKTRNSSGVLQYARALDDQGRLVSGRRLGLLGTEITDDNGFYETRSVYDDQGQRIEYSNYDASGNPLDDSDGIAVIRTTYTLYPDSKQIIESYFDATGQAAEEKSSGIHQRMRTVDNRGFITSESYYDATGAPTCDIEGKIHERRMVYDDKGNEISEAFYGIDGKLKNQKTAGYAKVIYRYDDKNRVSEKAYFGDDGSPQVLLDLGAAIIKQEYDDAGNLVRRQFFDGKRHPSLHQQLGAVAIRIKVDGDISTVSLRDDQDRPTQNPTNGFASFSYNTQTDQPLTRNNHYFDRHGKRLNLMRVFIINPHLHALREEPTMKWSARIGAGAAFLGALIAAILALRKSSHTKRRRVYVPKPMERFLGWFAVFAMIEGTLRFLITIYWAWVGYRNGEIGSGVYVLEAIVIVFFIYRGFRMVVTMRVLNIRREDIDRLVRDFLTNAHVSPKWVEEAKSYVSDEICVRLRFFQGKYHAYLSFYRVERHDLARGLNTYIRQQVKTIEGPKRSRAIAFYYPCVAICYFILSALSAYTLFELLKH